MSSRARVLQVLQPEDGGVAEHVLRLATGLAARGLRVEVAASPTNTIRPALAEAGIETHALPIVRRPGLHDIATAAALRRLDRDRHFDLVHAHSSKAGGLARAVLPDPGRLIYTPHCFAFATDGPRAERIAYRAIERGLTARSAAVVAVSESERALALRSLGAAASRVRLIRNGVPPCGDAPAAPELLEFADGRPLAGMVSVLRPQKDPLTAVRAAALLPDGDAAVPGRVAIVGNGELADAVKAEIATLGVSDRVRLFSFAPPVERYLHALDVFVLPSRWEALPLGPIEAMACSVAVVATPVGGTPEIVRHGRNGLLVPPEDPRALAAALGELMASADRRRELVEAGRASVSGFGLERMIDETERLYRDLLEQRAGRAPTGAPATSGGRTS